jgi:hypothetical protein
MVGTCLRTAIEWSTLYRADWDETPEAYLRADLVGWGRSRRLGRLAQRERRLIAYVGVQHFDPGAWGLAGEPISRFFASCRVGRQVWLRTYPTMNEALAALEAVVGGDRP